MLRTSYFFLFSMFCLASTISKGQNVYLLAGTQVPLQYCAGLAVDASKHWSLSATFGVLTKPYDRIILNVMEDLGTSEALVNTIGNAFTYGFIAQPGIQWNITSKYYIGLYGQYIYLQVDDAPKDLIESYYGVALSPKKSKTTGTDENLTIQSSLYNAGLLVGRKFNFRNSRTGLRVELSLAKNFYSISSVSSDTYYLSNLSSLVDEELSSYYLTYGYIPSVNLYTSFRINK